MTLTGLTVRVKRLKSTYFLQCNATDSILTLKKKLCRLTQKELKEIRLIVPKDKITTYVDYSLFGNKDKWAELEDKTVLDQIGVPDDAVIYMIFWVPGELSSVDGKWEMAEVPAPDPLVPPDDEVSASAEVPPFHLPGSNMN